MRKLLIVVGALLILAGLGAGLVYAAWETDLLVRPIGWVVSKLPMEEEAKLRLATQVIERLAPPFDVVELKVMPDGRVFAMASVDDIKSVEYAQFVQLWRATSRVGLALNPDMTKVMLAFAETWTAQYLVYEMYVCPGEKRNFEEGQDCQWIPIFSSLPAYAVRFAGR